MPPPDVLSPPEQDDPEETEYYVLAMRACQELADAGFRFRMSGFGLDDWPVDVSYDMSTVVEELPDLLRALRRREDFEVDMYGQGIERTIAVSVDGDRVLLGCRSRTSWRPDPATETLDFARFTAMTTDLAAQVAVGLVRIGSRLADHEPFRSWRTGEFD
ncbi:hypothetical protein ACFQ3B_00835 [Stackebrandtia endophytica]|uniref:hypothetical protein n=1 Tax=Stackebrandtia endophytica TaxID=1496996 RepID=UPI00114F38C7|nr:hypothetical protein [Stackebrandtia endophytica]